MVKWLFDRDELTGETQYFHAEDGDKQFTIETVADVAPIIEANREHFNQFNSVRDGYGDKIGGSTKVATIPNNIYYRLLKEFGRDPVAWKRWLNDPDNAAFRTRPGTV